MRVLNAIRRLLLILILIPVVAICLDTLLRLLEARLRNPIVRGVRDFADFFIIEPFTDVFPNQGYLQNAVVALVAFGVLALLVVLLFRGLASMAGSRPPRAQPAPDKPKEPEPAAPLRRPGSSTSPAESPADKEAGEADTADAAPPEGSDDSSKSSSG